MARHPPSHTMTNSCASNLSSIDLRRQVPRPTYNDTSPRSSDSLDASASQVHFPDEPEVNSELNALEKVFQDTFEIKKDILRKEFYSHWNNEKREWFLKTFQNEKQLAIQQDYYDWMTKGKKMILFLDWFDEYCFQYEIYYP